MFRLSDFYGGTSLKTYTSQYKSCGSSLLPYTQFMDSDLRLDFDMAVTTGNPKIIQMMSAFVTEFIDVKKKGVQLVRSLLGTINDDDGILEGDEFYVEPGNPVRKKELVGVENFTAEYFLLGVWHYIIMNRADKNEWGSKTYQSWYPSKGRYCGTVGNDIKQNITVDSIPAVTATATDNGDVLLMPSKTPALTAIEYSEEDKSLLQEFTSDYDELVLKCISAHFAEYVISEPISKEIADLYSKWSTKANEFQILSLKASIWAMLSHLNEFGEILSMGGKANAGPGLRQLQMRLRNLYVKLHPDRYADSFLYDAIYDDWNMGEDC